MTILSKDVALIELERLRNALVPNGGCLLCVLCSGAASPKPLAETDRAVVLIDRFARRPGHLLVVTRAHLEGVLEIDWQTHLDVQRLVYQARRALWRSLSPVQVYACTFGATASIPMSFAHHHVHVIPVFERDERARPARVLSWSEGVVVYDDVEAESLRRTILAAWTESPER
ncbi:MAG TPA: HIT domain-containing protein [Polyangiaceae bacterium]